MPLLTGAITVLALCAAPGRPPGSFAGKSAATADTKYVTDTYRPVLTLGDVTAVDVALTDRYVPTVTMSAVASLGKLASDTYVPVVTLAVAALQKAQGPDVAASDSYVPVLTLSAAVQVSGDVDRIVITARPYGRIHLREA